MKSCAELRKECKALRTKFKKCKENILIGINYRIKSMDQAKKVLEKDDTLEEIVRDMESRLNELESLRDWIGKME
jgi:hypothetical protein